MALSRHGLQVANETEADYVLYLLTGSVTADSPLHGRVAASRLVCLDYSDAPALAPELSK